MDIYLAPLEGVTGHVFREAYDEVFGNVSKYFTPFLSANDRLNEKTIRELNTKNLKAPLVPQILGNDAEKILALIEQIQDFGGFNTYNMNFGCPSGTVTAKGRGSGIFKDLKGMESLLDKIMAGCESLGVKLSLKTRIGWNNPDEWYDIVNIYANYPFEEIIIHPRVRADMYNGSVNREAFEYAIEHITVPLCYNGDIKTVNDYDELCKLFPTIDRVMIGRGIVRNPNLIGEIAGGIVGEINSGINDEADAEAVCEINKQKTHRFIELLEKNYLEEMKCEEHAVMRMKEFWYYYGDYVEGFEEAKKELKKSRSFREYKTATRKMW